MEPSPSIEVFVLAGGKSSRMGRDKGLVPLNGQPMISYILKVLEELALPISIITNRSGYESFGYRVLKDEIQEQGPMGGLYTALQNSSAGSILLVGCDMPLASMEAFCLLIGAAKAGRIAVASAGERINPLFALYPKELVVKVKESLDQGELKMTDLILKNAPILVTSIGEKLPWALKNINDKKELQEVEEKWKHLL